MPNWAFYVDESGAFSRPSCPVCVAGLLIDEDAPGNNPAALRASLVEAVPGLSWPLHASALNFSAYVGLSIWTALHRHHHHDQWWIAPSGDIIEAVEECHRFLQRVDGCTAVLACMRGEREPSHKVLRKLTHALEKSKPLVAETLLRHGHGAWAKVGDLLVRMAAAQPVVPPVWLVLSSETWRGDEADDTTGASRYNTLLTYLLTRLGNAITRLDLPGVQSVNLKVLKRSGPAPFARSHLKEIVAPFRERWPRVKLHDGPVVGFFGNLAAGYVLVDFASHRTCPILDEAQAPIGDVEEKIVELLKAPVPVRSADRSHLTAGMISRVPSRQWARDQAREWSA